MEGCLLEGVAAGSSSAKSTGTSLDAVCGGDGAPPSIGETHRLRFFPTSPARPVVPLLSERIAGKQAHASVDGLARQGPYADWREQIAARNAAGTEAARNAAGTEAARNAAGTEAARNAADQVQAMSSGSSQLGRAITPG